MMGLGMSVQMTTRLQQRQELTAEQKIEVRCALLQLRQDLTRAVRGADYQPRAECPLCARVLNAAEIIDGFLRDPEDITTKCPKCGHRFVAKLIGHRSSFAHAELSFMCRDQVRHALKGHADKSPDAMERESPAAFNSALYHWGALKAAFKSWGVDYDKETRSPWRDKVRPFLGMLPDRRIADVVGVSPQTIGRYRKSLNIRAFSRSKLVEEVI